MVGEMGKKNIFRAMIGSWDTFCNYKGVIYEARLYSLDLSDRTSLRQ